jgi:ubiquinol-cytochrome c reductase cytochrome c1 subunit
MPAANAKAWFGTSPPDLSVEARVRGSDWLYNSLLAFYRDDQSATGWNNLVFPNVAMPNVLWELSGTSKLVETEFEDHEKAQGAAIAARTLAQVQPAGGGKYKLLTVAPAAPGKLSRADYEAFVADTVNFMDYMAEPVRNERIRLGIMVVMFLGVLFVLALWTKIEFWKDVHK